jgi:DNA-binding MarR family transcriptional regulator
MSYASSDSPSNNLNLALENGNDAVAEKLRLAITRTARTLRQEAGGELTPTSLSALASISRHQPITPARLAEVESVRRPTATRVIAHLIDSGMVVRTADSSDRRSFTLALTDVGRSYLDERRSRKSNYISRLLKGLSPEDVAVLARAAEILEQSRTESPVRPPGDQERKS